jgi:hypothetical protein
MGRLTLKQMIINRCEEERGLACKLAEIGGYSSGSALLKILKDEKKEFAKFYGLVKIVRHLFPDQEKEIMAEYALTLDTNKQTARYMLEYLEINKQFEIQRKLIDEMLSSSTSLVREWAGVYNVNNMYLSGNIDYLEAINKFIQLQPKSEEMVITECILRAYCCYDKQMYDVVEQIILDVESRIMELKEEYMLQNLLGRYLLIKIAIKVRKNKVKEARLLCKSMMDNVNEVGFSGWAYLHMGNSYIIEDYQLAESFLKRGYRKVKEKHEYLEINFKRSLNFVNNLWDKDPFMLNPKSKNPSDVHEVVYYYINKKQVTQAKKTLDTLILDDLTENQKGFHYYLKGLLSNDISDFSRSVIHFKNSGDVLFRKLPLLKLEQLNINSSLIEALAV